MQDRRRTSDARPRAYADIDPADKLRNFLGHKFWARGHFVSTVGRDEEMIRTYIKNQEMADKQLDQLQLKLASS
jgi:REP element-mobilizing transposase RayT